MMQTIRTFYCVLLILSLTECRKAQEGIDDARQKYYRQAFTQAETFVEKVIDVNSREGNNTYVIVYDKSQNIVGYLRDMQGPVSPAQNCPCNPLNITFVFNPDFSLRTFLTPSPLQKYGHENLSEEEQKQLLAIAQKPSLTLLQVKNVEDVVDATTSATRTDLQPYVVKKAGLSSKRIVDWVLQSQKILKGETFVDNEKLSLQAYRTLVQNYFQTLTQSGNFDANIERQLLNADVDMREKTFVCYQFADNNLRLEFVEACLKDLALDSVSRSLLSGTLAYQQKKYEQAAKDLTAVVGQNPEPVIYQRLIESLLATQGSACEFAKQLYLQHPLYVPQFLKVCGDPQKTAVALDKQKHQALKQTRLTQAIKAPLLNVKDLTDKPVELNLAEGKKITVAVFFATWCPHCRKEFSRFNEFSRKIVQDKLPVRLVGIRTAIERENQNFADFVKEFKPQFPIYTDPSMSLAFASFAKAYDISAGLPTIAVLDAQGQVQFFVSPGDYNDTVKELLWLTDDVMMPRL